MVSSYQGRAKADTNQGPAVLGVFIISMTLSIIFYLSITSARSLVRSTVFCIVFLRFSGMQLPRTGQGGHKPRTSGPWCLGQWSLAPIVKPAVFNGSPPAGLGGLPSKT